MDMHRSYLQSLFLYVKGGIHDHDLSTFVEPYRSCKFKELSIARDNVQSMWVTPGWRVPLGKVHCNGRRSPLVRIVESIWECCCSPIRRASRKFLNGLRGSQFNPNSWFCVIQLDHNSYFSVEFSSTSSRSIPPFC